MTKKPPAKSDEARLSRSLEVGARLHAEELRVDESRGAEVRRGKWRSLRRGLPPEGAREGVTYPDVEVGIRIEGEARVEE